MNGALFAEARCNKTNRPALPTTPEQRPAQTVTKTSQKPLRLDNFIANLPCMAFQLVLDKDGAYSFSYIGDGSQALVGLGPRELETDIHSFLRLIHPEDSAGFSET